MEVLRNISCMDTVSARENPPQKSPETRFTTSILGIPEHVGDTSFVQGFFHVPGMARSCAEPGEKSAEDKKTFDVCLERCHESLVSK